MMNAVKKPGMNLDNLFEEISKIRIDENILNNKVE